MNFNNKSLEVWEREDSPENKIENSEKKQQENLEKSIKPIEQVRRKCLSVMASAITKFVNINFPEFNYKFEFDGSSRDISSEFTNKIMRYLNELEKCYPNKKNIISEYKTSVFGEINNLLNQLKSVTSLKNLLNIMKVFKEKKELIIGNHRTFYPSK